MSIIELIIGLVIFAGYTYVCLFPVCIIMAIVDKKEDGSGAGIVGKLIFHATREMLK